MKRIIIALTLCLILVGTIAVPAIAAPKAGAVQVPLYPVSGGSSNNVLTGSPSQGKVIANTPDGHVTLIFNGIVKDLDPNTPYYVYVRQIYPDYTGDYYQEIPGWEGYMLGIFTTDENGNGTFHLNILAEDLPTGTYNIQVAINYNPNYPSGYGQTVLATERYTQLTTGHE